MATFVVGKGNYIRPYRNTRLRTLPEGPSQTFKLGYLLILNTTSDKGHQVVVSGADPSAGTVVGIAMQDASGVENTPVVVAVFDEQAEFIVHVENTGTLDNDDIGDQFGFVADGTNLIHRLDRTETSAVVFRVVDFAPDPVTGKRFVHGDVNGAYIVTAAAGVQGLLRK